LLSEYLKLRKEKNRKWHGNVKPVGAVNPDSEDICEECGCLREEPCYDQMDDAGEE